MNEFLSLVWILFFLWVFENMGENIDEHIGENIDEKDRGPPFDDSRYAEINHVIGNNKNNKYGGWRGKRY